MEITKKDLEQLKKAVSIYNSKNKDKIELSSLPLLSIKIVKVNGSKSYWYKI